MDFKEGAMNAVRSVFQQVHVQGCFFTYVKLRGEKFKNLAPQQRTCTPFTTVRDFALKCRMIKALAFLKVNDVLEHLAKFYVDEVLL